MLEMFLIMLATAAQAPVGQSLAGAATSTGSTIAATEETAPNTSQSEIVVENSVSESTDIVAPPVFLAPKTAPDVAAIAPPAFLAPTEKALVAEPQVPTGKFTTAMEVKPILGATRGNWIAVREYDGKDLLYVTHLWSWRCGLLEMRVGINGNTPEPWPLPECHMDQAMPAVMLDSDGLPYREFGLGSIAMVEIQLTYDDLTTDGAKYNRQGVQIP